MSLLNNGLFICENFGVREDILFSDDGFNIEYVVGEKFKYILDYKVDLRFQAWASGRDESGTRLFNIFVFIEDVLVEEEETSIEQESDQEQESDVIEIQHDGFISQKNVESRNEIIHHEQDEFIPDYWKYDPVGYCEGLIDYLRDLYTFDNNKFILVEPDMHDLEFIIEQMLTLRNKIYSENNIDSCSEIVNIDLECAQRTDKVNLIIDAELADLVEQYYC